MLRNISALLPAFRLNAYTCFHPLNRKIRNPLSSDIVMERKLLKNTSLDEFIKMLREKGRCVIAPVRKNDRVDFEVITEGQTIAQDYVQTVQSPKHVLFPRVEELFHYEQTEDGVTLHENDLAQLPEIVLFGVRPCDTIGLKALLSFFSIDYTDALFNKRK